MKKLIAVLAILFASTLSFVDSGATDIGFRSIGAWNLEKDFNDKYHMYAEMGDTVTIRVLLKANPEIGYGYDHITNTNSRIYVIWNEWKEYVDDGEGEPWILPLTPEVGPFFNNLPVTTSYNGTSNICAGPGSDCPNWYRYWYEMDLAAAFSQGMSCNWNDGLDGLDDSTIWNLKFVISEDWHTYLGYFASFTVRWGYDDWTFHDYFSAKVCQYPYDVYDQNLYPISENEGYGAVVVHITDAPDGFSGGPNISPDDNVSIDKTSFSTIKALY